MPGRLPGGGASGTAPDGKGLSAQQGGVRKWTNLKAERGRMEESHRGGGQGRKAAWTGRWLHGAGHAIVHLEG